MQPPAQPTPAPAPRRHGFVARARMRMAATIGVTSETRFESARGMLVGHGKDRFGYWLQLVLAMGIATYGLVLGSTAVVIGAMLVSPLMGPLVEIGMGLVVGSPLLVMHSFVRTTTSVAVVVVLSALLTLALPYHEATPEIVSRTSPTLLDLYVASFCALAAAYTTLRKGSDTVAAAAGTAVSIALVPPLCVVGWGIGSRNAHAWRGAMLLFTANFCAIVLFSVVVFALLAYDTVDVHALEQEPGRVPTRGDRLAARARRLFGSKYGPALRLLMPLVFAAAVFVPLRSALNEVAWAVTTRAGIQKVLDALPPATRPVRTTVAVERHTVSIRLLIVGDAAIAAKLKADLDTKVAAIGGVVPSIEVLVVPDAEAIRLATQTLSSPEPVAAPPKPDLPLVEQALGAELHDKWPTSAVGELLTWRMVVGPEGGGNGGGTVVVVHFGAALGPAGEKLLADALGQRVGRDLSIQDLAMSESRVEASPERGIEWLPSLSHAVDQIVTAGVGYVCVTSATGETAEPDREQAAIVDEQITQQLKRLPSNRARVLPGPVWSVALSAAACPAATAELDAGTD